MNKERKIKYNDSCVKLFEFLKMLYEGDVEFEKVIELFSDGKYNGSSNTHVTLNKYLNSMKIFGIKLKKIKGKYRLYSPLSELHFDLNDIKSIRILKNAENILPEGKTKRNIEAIVRSLELRFDQKTQDISEVLESTKNLDFAFAHSDTTEQLKQCEAFCHDKLKLEIVYINRFGKERNLVCSPFEVLFVKKKLCLKAVGNNGSRIYEIPLESIKSVKQLPVSATKTSIPTTVVFKIKDRLALNYKLRKWEKLEAIDAEGNHIIVNKEEDMESLLKRLMKYGTDCELISPKFLREEMIQLINKTLSKYE